MAVIEALSKYRQESYDESPSVYVRPDKEQELDVLWQNFKINQKSGVKSPNIYLATGFAAGVVATLVLTALVTFSARIGTNAKAIPAEKPAVTATVATTAAAETVDNTYTVKSGDTIESIQVQAYGSYSKTKQDLIIKANNLTNPHKLSIGQKIIIPAE